LCGISQAVSAETLSCHQVSEPLQGERGPTDPPRGGAGAHRYPCGTAGPAAGRRIRVPLCPASHLASPMSPARPLRAQLFEAGGKCRGRSGPAGRKGGLSCTNTSAKPGSSSASAISGSPRRPGTARSIGNAGHKVHAPPGVHFVAGNPLPAGRGNVLVTASADSRAGQRFGHGTSDLARPISWLAEASRHFRILAIHGRLVLLSSACLDLS
jgi:hypothetical protein